MRARVWILFLLTLLLAAPVYLFLASLYGWKDYPRISVPLILILFVALIRALDRTR